MASLTRFLDDTPRIRLLEALAKAGDTEFTRAELAREAGQWRATVNRTIKDLEKESIVIRSGPKARPVYRVNKEAVNLRLLAYFEAALRMAERRTGEAADAVVDSFQKAVQRTVPSPAVKVGHVLVPVYAQLQRDTRSEPALTGSVTGATANSSSLELVVLDAVRA